MNGQGATTLIVKWVIAELGSSLATLAGLPRY